MADPRERYPFGAIDGKVSSVLSAKISPGSGVGVPGGAEDGGAAAAVSPTLPVIYARLGPSRTLDNKLQPFCWADFENATLQHRLYPDTRRDRVFSHYGHPECFDFNWQVFPPR